MKIKFIPLLLIAALQAQEPTISPATLIDPLVKEPGAANAPAPEPERLKIDTEDILSSKVVYREGQKFTIQEIDRRLKNWSKSSERI